MKILIVLMCLFLSACSNFGSKQLPPDRISYNDALQYSDEQQQLLNLVRLRYNDPPYFLMVNSIVSQFNFSSNYTLGVSNQAPPPALIGNGNAAYSFSTAPTITYTPLQGEDYVRKMLAPVDLSVIALFLRAGWSVPHILRMFVQELGDMPYAITASRPLSSRVPEYKEFIKVSSAIGRNQHYQNLIVSGGMIDNNFGVKLEFKKYNLLTPQERVILKRVGVTANAPYLWLLSQPTKQPNQLYVETRTILGVWNLLSKGVDIPKEHMDKKKVRMTYEANGKVFDWRVITKGIFRVRVCKSRPTDDFVSVQYHGYWYYIPDNDFESKDTFNMLSVMTGIYQGKVQSYLPVFTVS